MRYLDLDLMEKMCHRIAVAIFDSKDDPIPPFQNHTYSLLDSALNLPKQTWSGKELYPELVDKAAVLYYALLKNHPFRNGNKRIATAALLVFLFINDSWLDAGKNEIVEQAISITKSSSAEREEVLIRLKSWIYAHLIKM